MLVKATYVCLVGVLVSIILSCSPAPKLCVLKPYWDRENMETLQRNNCIPVQSYKEWNRCVGDCSGVKIQSKNKPYKAEDNQWTRPRPYTYP